MLESYEFEKRDRTIYDGIHKYCLTEKVNEEHFRVSVKDTSINRKKVTILNVLVCSLIIFSFILSILAFQGYI